MNLIILINHVKKKSLYISISINITNLILNHCHIIVLSQHHTRLNKFTLVIGHQVNAQHKKINFNNLLQL
jgi:hypothetical protein